MCTNFGMNSVAILIDRFGGNTRFAEIIGKAPSTASEMKRRRSIPVDYWPAIIAAAPAYGIEGLDSEFLMKIHVESPVAAPAD